MVEAAADAQHGGRIPAEAAAVAQLMVQAAADAPLVQAEAQTQAAAVALVHQVLDGVVQTVPDIMVTAAQAALGAVLVLVAQAAAVAALEQIIATAAQVDNLGVAAAQLGQMVLPVVKLVLL